jgi:hypothetical protein
MTRARDLSRITSPTNFTVDTANSRIGLGSENPTAKLNVSGIISATSFYGDGSNLEGVASAGLGTALGEDGTGTVIYYTDNTLGIGETFTVTVPAGSDVAYTQYAEVSVNGDADFIIASGDEFIPDVLGIGTDVQAPGTLSGGRIRADKIVSRSGSGAPQLVYGAEVLVGYGITGDGGINIAGVATAGSFVGDVTGNATGLTGTPNISVGVITATQYVGVPEGTNVLKAMLFV